MKHNKLLTALLRKNISISQTVGYTLANLVGLSIILIALQFYADAGKVISGEENISGADYIVITKHVSPIGGGNLTFSQEQIDDIKAQPWAADAAPFTAAQFSVSAAVNFGGRGMSTALFLEAVPDQFLDVKPKTWHYTPGEAEVPVILPKDYLSLYNFGFASTRGLPTVSEDVIGIIPISLYISGNGMRQAYTAYVVGFSSRINTIAVPQTFIDYANSVFADGNSAPSRVIVEISRPGDPDIETYLSENEYDNASGNSDKSQLKFFLILITGIVVAIGAIITLLSLFILLLSLHLLLQKNREKIHDLMMIGFTPKEIAGVYCRIVLYINTLALISAIIVMLAASHCWRSFLSEINISPAPVTTTCIVGAVIIIIVSLINFITINRQIKRSF